MAKAVAAGCAKMELGEHIKTNAHPPRTRNRPTTPFIPYTSQRSCALFGGKPVMWITNAGLRSHLGKRSQSMALSPDGAREWRALRFWALAQ